MTGQNIIETLFPELSSFGDSDFSRIGSDRPTLMIAMTARTGSSHLCSALSSVLPIGMPTELFNARHSLVWEAKRRNVTTYADLLADYIQESKDILVFKTNWLDFAYFKDRVWNMFPNLKIMYLNRLDIEAQAVSLHKAVVSGDWHDAPMIKRPPNLSEEELNNRFDLVSICHKIFELEKEKRSWEDYFFAKQARPLRMNYENFQLELGRSVEIIADYIGCPDIDSSSVNSDFKLISDKVNADWLIKVRNYRNGNFYKRYKDANITL